MYKLQVRWLGFSVIKLHHQIPCFELLPLVVIMLTFVVLLNNWSNYSLGNCTWTRNAVMTPGFIASMPFANSLLRTDLEQIDIVPHHHICGAMKSISLILMVYASFFFLASSQIPSSKRGLALPPGNPSMMDNFEGGQINCKHPNHAAAHILNLQPRVL